jgi:hypothetical protein
MPTRSLYFNKEFDMDNLPKNWFTSKTIWASLLTTVWPLIIALSGALHITLPAPDSIANVLASGGTVAMAALAIYGRVTAKAPIAKPSTPKATAAGIVVLLSLGLALTACSAAQKQTALDVANAGTPIAGQIAVDKATPAQLADLQTACDASGVLVAVADTTLTGGAAATVPKIAAPGAAFCKIVKAGKVPANADANSIPWLGVLSAAISTVKALAG